MTLLQQFVKFINDENLFHHKEKLLLAVSGGIDSVVLCELCRQAGFTFIIAHCNFTLRGEESGRDEQFVRSLGEHYGVDVLVKIFQTEQYAVENKLSIQVAARELRYAWFNEIVSISSGQSSKLNSAISPSNSVESNSKSKGKAPSYILTAHHADDNIETMLMNFFKGTGIAGLRGILPKQGRIIRPLLFAHKTAIILFAKENNLEYVEDSSNLSDKYTRNYFRNQLLPGIREVFAGVEENLSKNLARFRETEQLYQQAIDLHKKKLLEIKGDEIYIPALKLKKSVPLETITYEIIKNFGFTPPQAKEVIDLIDSESGKYVQSAMFRIIKNRNWLIISPKQTETSQIILIDEADNETVFEAGKLTMKQIPIENYKPSVSSLVAQLDTDEIRFPLLLRKWKQGDYFYPLGMKKKKKLNRFLSDLKLPVTEKENTWLLEMNKKIIWVIGRRIDDRFKIKNETSKIIQINLLSNDQKQYSEKQ